MAPDIITFVITFRSWPVSGNDQIRNISPRVSGITRVGSAGSLRKKQTGRRPKGSRMNTKRPSRTKRSLRQAQAVLDRLHEELSGERVVRTSLRQYLDDWFDGKKAETAPSTMTFLSQQPCEVFAVSRQALG
jgi:hypothetical protein